MDTLDMLILQRPDDYEVRARPEPEMARKRLSTPGFIASTKGHSVLRNKWGYGGRAVSPVDDLYLTDVYRPRYSTYYDTTGTENEIRKNVNRELLFSTHAADDAFDMASKSRHRDQQILREASQAIVDTDIHANPKAAVASRRARSHSHFTYHHPTVVPRSYIPPPKTITTISTPSQSYVRRPRKEAALVGSRVDVVTPKSRKPKSEYAANVIRRLKKEGREQTVSDEVLASPVSASKPVSASSTRGGKAIRDVDGFTQPKNVLSWQGNWRRRYVIIN